MAGWWRYAAASAAVFAAGCTTVPKTAPQIQPAPGHQRVVPAAYAMVGRIYREGVGERPWLVLNGQTVYSEICWNDFLETTALKTLDDQHVVAAKNVIHPSATSTLSIKISAGYSGTVAGAAAGASASADTGATYSLSNLRLVTLTDTGRRFIESEIGDSCRKLVRENLAAGRKVVILVEGLRADSGKQTAGTKINLAPKVGPVSGGLVTDAGAEITTSNLLVSARLGQL